MRVLGVLFRIYSYFYHLILALFLVGIATVAVGAISEADHANSIIAAGRADLCAIARPHLADTAWILHEAAKIGVKSVAWPKQYLSAKLQYEANLARAATPRPN